MFLYFLKNDMPSMICLLPIKLSWWVFIDIYQLLNINTYEKYLYGYNKI